MDNSLARDDDFIKEMIEYYGKMPNPQQYPIRFEFLTQSFEHRKKMQENKLPQKKE